MSSIKVSYGGWHISSGKGNRVYINYDGPDDNCEGLMHSDVRGLNGLGIYGHELLKDLGAAILKFEKAANSLDSIASRIDE